MKTITRRVNRSLRRSGLFPISCGVFAIVCLSASPAFAQCTLNSAPTPCTLTGANFGAGDTFVGNPGSSTSAEGPISNAGSIQLVGGSDANTALNIDGDTTLNGTGTLTLAYNGSGNGQAFLQQGSSGVTLTNASTIQGVGMIGNGDLTLNNQGLVNANAGASATLLLNGAAITNTNLLEATNGTLQIATNVNNVGGNITANGANAVVNVNSTVTGGTLSALNSGILQTSGSAVLDGGTNAVTINGTYSGGPGSTTTLNGTINNLGTIVMTGGSDANTTLAFSGNTILQGGGTLTLAYNGSGNGQAFVEQSNSGVTLTNASGSTIQGQGTIGNGGLTLNNQGVINANAGPSTTLLLNGGGGITNTNLLEATNGTLQIATNVNNVGGNITANGANAVVNVNATITGGTLSALNGGILQTSSAATLDGSTNAITIHGTYSGGPGSTTTLNGTINNLGTIVMTGGSDANTTLALSGNTTLQGGGTLTLAYNGSGNGQAFVEQLNGGVTLTNASGSTIQGQGTVGNGGLTLNNQGVINANAGPSTTLLLNGGGGITNTNLLEATNGTLQIATNVNNVGGNITASGANAVVNVNATITGGTLSALNGGILQTSSAATLDGSTNGGANAVTINGTYSGGTGSTTSLIGTINNQGTIVITGGSDSNAFLDLNGNTTLQGGGTLTLAYNGSGNGQAYIQQIEGGITLTNASGSTIQGQGTIGNGGLTLNNQGVVNANAGPSATLLLNNSGGTINTNLLEATNGTLQISSDVNNVGGNITADGAHAVVNVSSTITGGTLNSSNGGTLQTISSALLDGSTNTVTISKGTTYSGGTGTTTALIGTIDNKGTILITAGNDANTFLNLNGNTTLQGGGTLTLAYNGSGNGQVFVQQVTGGITLTNADNTIQGQGVIGSGGLAVDNHLHGTILANVSGGTLTINGTGGISNEGTLQTAAGSTMLVQSNLTNFNETANKLTGGTYDSAGNLQIDSVVSSGGGIISNASTIILDGPAAKITDSLNQNALANLQDNVAGGSFTVENGQAFITSANGADFENDGTVNVGGGAIPATFTTANDYNQGGGITQVDGTLIATGGEININGGTLAGLGTAIASVTIGPSGTLSPGDPGDFNIIGDLLLNGTYDEQIAGTGPGQFDEVVVSGAPGTANIGAGSTLDISLDGFNPGVNAHDSFVILDALGGRIGEFTNVDFTNPGLGETYSLDYSNPDEVILDLNGPVSAATPEPGFYIPLMFGIAVMIGFKVRARRQSAAAPGSV